MWDSITPPWQATLELVWEAYCDNCLPIATLITDAEGVILSRGRNRIRGNRSNSLGFRPGNRMAHAEVEASNSLDYNQVDHRSCVLYTSTEPCPICLGTFYMAGLRILHYASCDPYAGSINLLGKTPHLSVKSIQIVEPVSTELETVIMALYVEKELSDLNGNIRGHVIFDAWRQIVLQNVAFGEMLYQTGTLHQAQVADLPVREVSRHSPI